MTTDSGLRDIKIFPEELGKIFEQAYKDLPGVSRGAIHSLVLRGVKYATTTPCANCERLEAEFRSAKNAGCDATCLNYRDEDTVRDVESLITQLQEANAKLAAAKEAIEFYAQTETSFWHESPNVWKAEENGKRAREALAQIAAMEGEK